MSTPTTRDPLAVTTSDGTAWVRRAVTRGGRGLYAPEDVTGCPKFVMATLEELAEHGLQGQPLAEPGALATAEAVEQALSAIAAAEGRPAVAVYPPALPWAKWLDEEDLHEFVGDLASLALDYFRPEGLADEAMVRAIEKLCSSWRLIADATRAHLTAPGPACTCSEPVLECTGEACGCPVCHRAVVPASAVLAKRAESEGLPVAVAMSEQVGSRLRRLLRPLDGGVSQ